jgi:uncharacterized protein with HEPN domain
MEKNNKFLYDILMAIERIELFLKDVPDFNAYEKDLKTQSAIERQLGIIGEALNKLRKSDTSMVIEHDHQIISLRNRLVHAYDSIDNTIVWAILKKHLENLKKEVESFLG